jgi:hypothetical protein
MSGVNVFHSPEISRFMTTPVLLEQIETVQKNTRSVQQNAVDGLYTHDQRGSTTFFENLRLIRHRNLRHTTWLTISVESRPVILKTPNISADTREGINELKVNDGPSLVLANLETNSSRNE